MQRIWVFERFNNRIGGDMDTTQHSLAQRPWVVSEKMAVSYRTVGRFATEREARAFIRTKPAQWRRFFKVRLDA
jgi:hypothetical protein